jgi:hypothetical protein
MTWLISVLLGEAMHVTTVFSCSSGENSTYETETSLLLWQFAELPAWPLSSLNEKIDLLNPGPPHKNTSSSRFLLPYDDQKLPLQEGIRFFKAYPTNICPKLCPQGLRNNTAGNRHRIHQQKKIYGERRK